MNMPRALAVLWGALKSELSGPEKIELVERFDSVLGLNLLKEEKLPKGAAELIEERDDARKKQDWDRADKLREKLKEIGVVVEDTPKGTKWKRTG
jgi:cysteinyl-tRNA synthetase